MIFRSAIQHPLSPCIGRVTKDDATRRLAILLGGEYSMYQQLNAMNLKKRTEEVST